MNDIERNSITNSISIINQILPRLDNAIKKFKSARNWGFFDVLGGGFITDLIKHSSLNSAANEMNYINSLLQNLNSELKNITFSGNFSMNTMTFATLADFVFDGIIADVYMQSKIMKSLSTLEELKAQLLSTLNKLKMNVKFRREI